MRLYAREHPGWVFVALHSGCQRCGDTRHPCQNSGVTVPGCAVGVYSDLWTDALGSHGRCSSSCHASRECQRRPGLGALVSALRHGVAPRHQDLRKREFGISINPGSRDSGRVRGLLLRRTASLCRHGDIR